MVATSFQYTVNERTLIDSKRYERTRARNYAGTGTAWNLVVVDQKPQLNWGVVPPIEAASASEARRYISGGGDFRVFFNGGPQLGLSALEVDAYRANYPTTKAYSRFLGHKSGAGHEYTLDIFRVLGREKSRIHIARLHADECRRSRARPLSRIRRRAQHAASKGRKMGNSTISFRISQRGSEMVWHVS